MIPCYLSTYLHTMLPCYHATSPGPNGTSIMRMDSPVCPDCTWYTQDTQANQALTLGLIKPQSLHNRGYQKLMCMGPSNGAETIVWVS